MFTYHTKVTYTFIYFVGIDGYKDMGASLKIASSTKESDRSNFKIFDHFVTGKLKMALANVNEDNIQEILGKFCTFLISDDHVKANGNNYAVG